MAPLQMSLLGRLFGSKRIDIKPEEMSWRRDSPPPISPSLRQSGTSSGDKTTNRQQSTLNSIGRSRDKPIIESPTKIVYGAQETTQRPFKANSSTFYRYRAETLKNLQQQPIDYETVPQSKEQFPSYSAYTEMGRSQEVAVNGIDWNEPVTQNTEETENIYEIEKRVSLRMMAVEEPVQQPRLRTDIFAEPKARQATQSQSSLFHSKASLPSVSTVNAIAARPETSMRKLQIFENIARGESDGQRLGGAQQSERTKELQGTQVIKATKKKTVDNEIKDFDFMIAENRRLADELHSLEAEHRNAVNDPHNMNVQEANFKILLETTSVEERKRDGLRKDNQALAVEIANRQSELTAVKVAQVDRTNKQQLPVDYRERERLLNEIERTREEILAKRLALENQRISEADKAAKVREISERQMKMELESNRITVNNSTEALLKELRHFQKEYL